MRRTLTELGRGFALFARGQAMVWRRPGLVAWAVLPPLLVFAVLFSATVVLATYAEPLVTWATPFANGWNTSVAAAARWIVAVALVLGFVYVAVRTFAVITLALGHPVYVRIQRIVDRSCGGSVHHVAPEVATRWNPAAELAQGVGESLAGGGAVFLLGLIPVAGDVVAPGAGALLGANGVVKELIEPAFSARGLGSGAHRSAAVKAHRAAALGFGLPAYLALLVPFLGVALFPGAVAGGTLLARHMCGEPTTPAAT